MKFDQAQITSTQGWCSIKVEYYMLVGNVQIGIAGLVCALELGSVKDTGATKVSYCFVLYRKILFKSWKCRKFFAWS